MTETAAASNATQVEESSGILAGLLPDVAAAVQRALVAAQEESTGPTRAILGVPDGAKASVIAALARLVEGPVVVISARPNHAATLFEDVQSWLSDDVERLLQRFPPRETVPYEHRSHDREAAHERLTVLTALAAGADPLILTDIQALGQRTSRPAGVLPELRVGGRLSLDEFVLALDAAGYRQASVVDEQGTFARRGGIMDVFPSTQAHPLRIELFGDEIDSLRRFDPRSQRSIETVQVASIDAATEAAFGPAGLAAGTEKLLISIRDGIGAMADAGQNDDTAERFARDLSLMEQDALPENLAFWTPFLAEGSFWEHLPPSSLVVWDEADDIQAHASELDELAQHARGELENRGEIPAGLPLPHMDAETVLAGLRERRPRVDLHRFGVDGAGTQTDAQTRRVGFQIADSYGGRLRELIEALRGMQTDGSRVVLTSQQAPRLAEVFSEYGLAVEERATLVEAPAAGMVTVVHASTPSGWRLPSAAGELILLSDTEIFGFQKQRRARPRTTAKHESFLEDLEPGDYVVHVEHGIAKFLGTVHEVVGGRELEYLELSYADSDRLLVPTDQLHRVQRYVGPSERAPTLTRLGTQQWARAKQRVRESVRELAEDLLQLYASRQVLPGIEHAPDTHWQMELEASFPYVETPDQARAVRDVKADMERSLPMDRIVVGDVGYGKTEVAVRGAFKAVGGGYQVAMLVPTTVLAQQHFKTFQERTAAFPVRVGMLSRFRTPQEQKEIVADVAAGKVDILVGTHRMLGKDVSFKNLGLLIIDEEQRFGVGHKETLKRLRQEVDVLTLSATPIPRTLHMAVTGIRDMSTIETPPEARLPITTYVMEADDQVVREAILREIERGGQVYFVHNRVRTIEAIARWLRELVPEAQFLVGHGQMPEVTLQRVMAQFIGLDISNVNTIVLHKAQLLGLAQMYQLRGRVGRGAQRAYAYLLYDRDHALTEVAQKRLQTVFDATELGAGFQIAQKDLEIRGAGNLLGAEQSGQIGAVGFELYTQLLSEAVEQAKARRERRKPVSTRRGPAVSVDLPVVAHLPPSYVDDVNARLQIYQRLAAVEDLSAVGEVEADLRDRFGDPPEPVLTLLQMVRLRCLAARLGAESLQTEEQAIVLRLVEGLTFPNESRVEQLPEGFSVGRTLLKFQPRRGQDDWLEALGAGLEQLGDLFPAGMEPLVTSDASS
jgi:transcription-repair coupling factor (superfamily II helicase)